LWLIFVEAVIISFAWTFDFTLRIIILQVIWAIGISMVFMSGLIRLPYKMIFILGTLIVFGHNLLDTIESTHQGLFWDLVRNGNFAFHDLNNGRTMVIIYPFVPWLGLMMLGYCFGKIYDSVFSYNQRRKILIRTGGGLIIFFIILRMLNFYGDPSPWELQSTISQTIFSFLDVNKYPPSLLFMSITIGPALIFLALFESINNKITQTISVFGKVPFFYYILHFYFLHLLCTILFLFRGHSIHEATPDIFGIPFKFMIVGEGYSLTIVYIIWISLVIFLYPLCKWFSTVKSRKSYWWLSYL